MQKRRIKLTHLAWILLPLTLIGVALWFTLHPDDILHLRPLAPRATANSTNKNEPNTLLADTSPAERAATTSTSAPADSTDNSAEPSLGRLNIRVVDDATNAAIAGADCTVYSERGGDKVHAKLTTDADGRASVENLPVNTILVAVRRTDTHAAAVGGVWLKRAETRELVIRAGQGSTVVGRVVDDTGAPIARAELLFGADIERGGDHDEALLSSTRVATTTRADGRFELLHVAPTPAAVWIVDGELRPERWNFPTVYARIDRLLGFAGIAKLETNGPTDIGDIVIERARTWRGRVIDARGDAVEGALVSFRWQRERAITAASTPKSADALWPGRDGFRLAPGEVLTAADGSFTLHSPYKQHSIVVWTRSEIQQTFETVELAPGATSDELELRMKDLSVVEFELVDVNGAPIKASNPRFKHANFSRSRSRSFFGNLVVALTGSRELRLEVTPRADGLFRAFIEGSLAGFTRIHVALGGYLDVVRDLDAPLAGGDRLKFTLAELPSIRVHLVVAKQQFDTAGGKYAPWLLLYACMLTPDQRERRTHSDDGCCGLGSTTSDELKQGERDVELPVLANKPFWIYATIPVSRPQWSMAFGPFEPGAALNKITIPAIDPAIVEDWRSKAGGETAGPPPPSKPGENIGCGTLKFRVVDAMSGAPIAQAEGELDAKSPLSRNNYQRWVTADKLGRASSSAIAAGSFELRIRAEGYKKSNAQQITIVVGETTDLSTIALEPAPVHKLVLTESDGAPIPALAIVKVHELTTMRSLTGVWHRDPDGPMAIHDELPDRFLVSVNENRADEGGYAFCAKQVVEVARGVDGVTNVRLEPWCALEVRVNGAATELPSSCRIAIRKAGTVPVVADPLDPNRSDDPYSVDSDELEPLADGRRRFRAFVAAGKFVIEGRSALFSIPTTPIEVHKRDEVQLFEVSSSH